MTPIARKPHGLADHEDRIDPSGGTDLRDGGGWYEYGDT